MLDLIDECGQDLLDCGYETEKLDKFQITLNKLFVDTPAKAKKLGFDRGHYFIINAPLFSHLVQEHVEILQKTLLLHIRFLLRQNKLQKGARVLFVGIGNPQISADSFGVKTVEKIEIFPFKKNNNLFKMTPNVFANTGLNAFEMIKLVVEAYDISAVFLFDSLATNNFSRLGCSLQFNDAGLTPGSANNNFGMPINKQSLCVPCFSVGVPTMMSSLAFKQKKDVILTDKDVEKQIDGFSDLVSGVFNQLFGAKKCPK